MNACFNGGDVMRYQHYIGCCVHLSGSFVTALMDQAREISYRTFLRQVGNKHLSATLPDLLRHYQRNRRQGLTLKDDWHVRYYRASQQGKRYYILRHSAIEYIFAEGVES